MRKILIKDCRYAFSPVNGEPRFCDMYVLVDDDGQMLWHENLFLCDMAKGCSLNTLRGYANDLLSFAKMAKPLGGWRAIGQSAMTGYLHAELFQHRGYALATMMRHIETLKRFFGWLEKKGYLTAMPDFEWSYTHLYNSEAGDKAAHHINQHSFHSLYLDRETFHSLLANVRSENPFIEVRDRLVLRLGYECGMRASEVLTLNAVEVRRAINEARDKNDGLWATTRVKIRGKGAKNRDLFLPPQLSEYIIDYLAKYRHHLNNRHGNLICTTTGLPIQDKKHASTVFSNACRLAKIPRSHRQGYHRLRKSFGTHLVQDCYDNGDNPWVEVPRRLGHQDIETTMLYIQFDALRNNRSNVLTDLRMMHEKYKAIQHHHSLHK